jgi:hypothetical protein
VQHANSRENCHAPRVGADDILPALFPARQLNGEPQSKQEREERVELVVDEQHDEWLDDAIERRRGQLCEPRIRENHVCGDPHEIGQQHTEERKAAHDINQVDSFDRRNRLQRIASRCHFHTARTGQDSGRGEIVLERTARDS